MNDDMVKKLMENHSIIKTDMVFPVHVKIVLNNLEKVLNQNIEGDVVELGCNAGTTSLFIKRFLTLCNSQKEFHAYDSFLGLPDKHEKDKSDSEYQFNKGNAHTFKMALENNFKLANLELPIIHHGWFKDMSYPNKICFAFFDGDFYTSILDSFEKVYPRLTKGGIIVIHDYSWNVLPGVKIATNEFLADKPETILLEEGMAIITKV